MTTENVPNGTPIWADLWTSDVEASRRFYGELFGWESTDPIVEFGGYFNFLREGGRIAGAMGDMGDMGEMKADNRWKGYFATDDAAKTSAVAEREGGTVVTPAMPVADLGVQAILVDPTGATFGLWQPGSHRGFATRNEPGAPSWFELHTSDYARAIEFYEALFGYELSPIGDGDEVRYSVARTAAGEDVAGITQANDVLRRPSQWGIYWQVEDPAATLTKARELGGAVLMDVDETPYGRLAAAADPAGAEFWLRGLTR